MNKGKHKNNSPSPFPLDKSGVAIVTFLDKRPIPEHMRMMNVSALARGEELPEPNPDMCRMYDLDIIPGIPLEHLSQVAKVIETAFEELRAEKIIVLELRNVPGITLETFCPELPIEGALQWEPEDIQTMLQGVRVACNVTTTKALQ